MKLLIGLLFLSFNINAQVFDYGTNSMEKSSPNFSKGQCLYISANKFSRDYKFYQVRSFTKGEYHLVNMVPEYNELYLATDEIRRNKAGQIEWTTGHPSIVSMSQSKVEGHYQAFNCPRGALLGKL